MLATKRSKGFIAVLLAALGVGVVSTLATAKVPTLRVEYFQTDSARIIAKWAKACDNKGCADAYEVTWVMPSPGGDVRREVRGRAALVDTFKVQRPALGAPSLVATVSVVSVRRGLKGPARSASVTVASAADAPPPPVDSLRVDTTVASRIDSLRMTFETLAGVALAGMPVMMAERDTVRIVARWYVKPGRVRQLGDTAVWAGEAGDDPAPFMKLQPIGGGFHADTALLIALDCRCRETGNRPRLDMRSGEYVQVTPR